MLNKWFTVAPDGTPTVIHGEWLMMSDSDGFYYCCSDCGEELPRYMTHKWTYDEPYQEL